MNLIFFSGSVLKTIVTDKKVFKEYNDRDQDATNGHEADLVFGRELPQKIKNFDETWVKNAQPRILISYKFFHITATGGSHSDFAPPTTKLEILPAFTEYLI